MNGAGRIVAAADGRAIGYEEFGDAAGAPVLYCHGFPASRLEGRLAAPAAARQRVRLIAIDRPGYGLSRFLPGRRIGDWPADAAKVADALGIGRFAVLGVSGGGPYALACAVKIPGRVTGIGVVAGLAPPDPELLAGMNSTARFSFGFVRSLPWLAQHCCRALALLLRRKPEWVLALVSRSVAECDRAVLARAEVKRQLADSFREALRNGGRGAAWELVLYARPWDFGLAGIRVPCHLWHGEQDTTVPVAMGRRLATEIPGCLAEFPAGDGHYSLPVTRMDDILGAVARR